eukprot:4277350-Alexandrium_andersonii.AAC.1
MSQSRPPVPGAAARAVWRCLARWVRARGLSPTPLARAPARARPLGAAERALWCSSARRSRAGRSRPTAVCPFTSRA